MQSVEAEVLVVMDEVEMAVDVMLKEKMAQNGFGGAHVAVDTLPPTGMTQAGRTGLEILIMILVEVED